jgi:hypothetical protein
MDLNFDPGWESDTNESAEEESLKKEYEKELYEISNVLMFVLRGEEGGGQSRLPVLQNWLKAHQSDVVKKVPTQLLKKHLNGMLLSAFTFSNFNVAGFLIKEMGVSLPTESHPSKEYNRIDKIFAWSKEDRQDCYGFRSSWRKAKDRLNLIAECGIGECEINESKKRKSAL